MEKTRKLRLKRKLPQQKVLVTSENSRKQNIIEAEAVTLSSDSEDASDGQQCKQRKVIEHIQPCVKSIGFLQTNNPSLNRLREMILSLSPKDMELDNISPFPTLHTQIEPNSTGSRTVMFQERLQPPTKVQPNEDLPPFPKLCSHYRRQPLESQTVKQVSNPNLETSDSDILKRTHAIYNGCTEQSSSKESIQTDFKQSTRTSALKDSNNKACKIQTSFTNVVGDNNSGTIRDRNSNLYALQTRNRHMRPEDRNPEPSGSDTCTRQTDRNIVKTCSRNSQPSILNKQTDQERTIMEKDIDECEKLSKLVVNNETFKSNMEDSKDVSTSREHQKKEGIKSGGMLQNCPLCQMEFDSRCGQMEIDSHIATCLSSADDDVVW